MATAEYDLVVAGAGPAGAACACAARLAGLRVAVLDDSDEQLWKVGESLPGAVQRTLRRLQLGGPEQLLAAGELERCTANLSAWGSERWTHQDALANPEGGGWHVLRHRFDAALRRHATELGVEPLRGRWSSSPAIDGARWNVAARLQGGETVELTARFLVDATGRRALLTRQLGVRRRRLSRQSAIVGWIRRPLADEDRTTRSRSVQDGWWYTAPVPQGARVIAFHGLPATIAAAIKNPALFVERCNAAELLPYALGVEDLLLPPRTSDASVQLAERVAGPGWLAVGDAALSFDPLSSQGVLFALYSGIRGAEAIATSLEQPQRNGAALGEYAARVHSVLRANQRARWLLYSSELRYRDAEYWRRQRESCAPVGGPGVVLGPLGNEPFRTAR
ncbi:MAG TPA: tryptophan 7-halogenase [Polyangiaceae bacterium]|nr:tryptophan 7-halogenase [Polyangiaceae bacterium]